MTTLLHTIEGCSPMHELVESEIEAAALRNEGEKHLFWEVIRNEANTFGARNALDMAIGRMEARP